MLHVTYQYVLPWIAPGKQCASVVAKKWLFTQTVFTMISIGTFYATVPLFQGQTLNESYEELYNKMIPTLKTNYKVWPILQMFNFTFVPMKLQPLFVAVMSLFWNTYLSFMKYVYQVPAVDGLGGDDCSTFVPSLEGSLPIHVDCKKCDSHPSAGSKNGS